MSLAETLLHRIYLAGYSGVSLPRWSRKLFARSELHRAWLCGFNGCFEEGGIKYGPAKPYGQEASQIDAQGKHKPTKLRVSVIQD